ncbi:hypothetical protein K6119_02510 [Paracrocinitomix mangrovi]|uniref:hypothetical protein n=1 Tax=Paracrocinitomix mangrovi TaxID=2862509 RepID=UPI001C8EC5D3|nr:hypothetical protein [Paracrocinitomix mangrovi]UKN02392.1 hypothetical protein K6119_02510 [Paracrocinitomix mangrovi]
MAIYKMSPEGIETQIQKTQKMVIVFIVVIVAITSSILIFKDREYDQSRIVSLSIFGILIVILFFYMRNKIKKTLTSSFESLEYEITTNSIIRRLNNIGDLEIMMDDIKFISKTKKGDYVIISDKGKMAISRHIEDLDNLLSKLPEVKDN